MMTEEEFKAEWTRLERVFADMDQRLGRGILMLQIVAGLLTLGSAAMFVWLMSGLMG